MKQSEVKLKKALKELLEEEADRVPDDAKLRKSHTFSRFFLKNMEKLAGKEDRREHWKKRGISVRSFRCRPVIFLCRAAAGLAGFGILIMAAAMAANLFESEKKQNQSADMAMESQDEKEDRESAESGGSEGAEPEEEVESGQDGGNGEIQATPPELTVSFGSQTIKLSACAYSFNVREGKEWHSVTTDAASPLMADYGREQTLLFTEEQGGKEYSASFHFTVRPDTIVNLRYWSWEDYRKEEKIKKAQKEDVWEENGNWKFSCPEKGGIYELSVKWQREDWKGTASYYFCIR